MSIFVMVIHIVNPSITNVCCSSSDPNLKDNVLRKVVLLSVWRSSCGILDYSSLSLSGICIQCLYGSLASNRTNRGRTDRLTDEGQFKYSQYSDEIGIKKL